MIPTAYESAWTTEETRIFRNSVRQLVEREFVPHEVRWGRQGRADKDAWLKAGQAGLLLADVPKEYGGAGGTFAHEAVVVEELARAGVHVGLGIQGIVAHYILAYGNEAQRRRWLPRLASGELIAAIGMTEADAGSDLQAVKTTARRDGEHYVVNGSKTFITNGTNAGLLCLAVRMADAKPGPRALTMLVLETEGLAGYRVGRSLEKIGRPAQDACELFFDDVRVPVGNVLGGEGRGLMQMMEQLPYERLSIALSAVAATERAIEITAEYVKSRKLYGKPLVELQATRFKLAEAKTEAHVGRVFVDDCIGRFVAGSFDAVTAAMAKLWLTEMQCRVIDDCVQLHGGYGYMWEYPVARAWADARVQRIYAGTNEVMKLIVSRALLG